MRCRGVTLQLNHGLRATGCELAVTFRGPLTEGGVKRGCHRCHFEFVQKKKKTFFSEHARTLCSFQTASADSEVSESLGSHLQKSFGEDESVKYSESFSPAWPLVFFCFFFHIHLTNGFIYWVYMTSCIFLARDHSLIHVFFLVWSRAIWVFSHRDKHAATVHPHKLFQGFESVLWSLTVRVTIMHWRKNRKQVMQFFFFFFFCPPHIWIIYSFRIFWVECFSFLVLLCSEILI